MCLAGIAEPENALSIAPGGRGSASLYLEKSTVGEDAGKLFSVTSEQVVLRRESGSRVRRESTHNVSLLDVPGR